CCVPYSPDTDNGGLSAQNRFLIAPFHKTRDLAREANALAPEPLEPRGATPRCVPAGRRHRGCEGLPALAFFQKVVLDRDRGTKLIDAQAEAPGMIWEERIVGRQRGVGR